MSRRRAAEKRSRIPDPIYNSDLVTRLIGAVMLDGKKSTAEHIVYGALEQLKATSKSDDALACFEKAVGNVKPILEVKSRRVGGATYQVPVEVRAERRSALALRWIVRYSRDKKGKSMEDKLAQELLDAFNKTGSSYKKREDTHKMAEANKAFAHFRW